MTGCIVIIPIINMCVLLLFGCDVPTYDVILVFAFYGAIYKFSSAGVPAGGLIILYPLLINIFGYSSEMLVVITSIYVLLDIVATTGSIIFNNLLSIVLYRVYNKN